MMPLTEARYEDSCRGPGSDSRKRKLLGIFLASGCDTKSKQYINESYAIISQKGQRNETEWVPLASILRHYGINEAWRRINRGSITARKDPSCPEEWQFRQERQITYSDDNETETHSAVGPLVFHFVAICVQVLCCSLLLLLKACTFFVVATTAEVKNT